MTPNGHIRVMLEAPLLADSAGEHHAAMPMPIAPLFSNHFDWTPFVGGEIIVLELRK
jgi:hypothetical protein